MFLSLHSSSVIYKGKAIAFSAQSGMGKSTLASTFIQTGANLLTDDILPLEEHAGEFWGRPGLPQINLWPDQALHFLLDGEESELKNPRTKKRWVPVEELKHGDFCYEKQPLVCIYLPTKYEVTSNKDDIEILPIPPAEAVIELVRNSFIPSSIFEKLGWQKRRLEFFSRLVQQVPIRRLTYPSGFEHLPRVTEAVLKDLQNLPSKL